MVLWIVLHSTSVSDQRKQINHSDKYCGSMASYGLNLELSTSSATHAENVTTSFMINSTL